MMPAPTRKRLTAVDLFGGCGGLTTGLRRAGFKILGMIENDPLAVKTYSSNHRTVRVWTDDIGRVSVKAFMRELHIARGDLHLLAGCPPCQGFSRIRTRNGKKTMRYPANDLIEQFLRFVRGLFP